MAKCPNCGRETMRTEDWACQWCGYPLMSKAFRKIDKTYRELQAERLREASEKSPEPIAEARPVPPPPPLPPPPPPSRPSVPETPKPAPPPPPEPVRVPEPRPEPKPPAEPPAPEPEVRSKAPESAPPATSPVIELGPSPQPQALPKTEVRAEAESAPPITAPEAATTPPQTEAPPKPEVAHAEPEPELPPGVIRVTVSDLNQLFRTDRSAADAQFSNKTLRVVGVLEKVVYREVLDTAYIMLTSPEKGEWNVRCVFDKRSGPQLMRLGEKNTVIVQGTYAGCERNIILKDCALV